MVTASATVTDTSKGKGVHCREGRGGRDDGREGGRDEEGEGRGRRGWEVEGGGGGDEWAGEEYAIEDRYS